MLDKTYTPADHEPAIAKKWANANAFHADAQRSEASDLPPFSIVIPPPNVTAALHMGHALNNTIQDILTRAHRMRGHRTLWMPGTDHAGIATQSVVDKRLQAEAMPALKEHKRMEADGENGRDQFIAKIQAWKDEYEQVITHQLQSMGCSCDWARQRFTMDDVCARAVREAFFQLFKDGLIYRGKRLVNWDPVSQTALSDDEVEMEDIDGNFYYMQYPLCDPTGVPTSFGTHTHVTVATTRPETMLGDTAVAVNPSDTDRAHLIGQFVQLPIVGRVIPIVGDDYVVKPDKNSDDAKAKMASGFLKVTPAHDPNDYDIGQRHDLDAINVMAPDASISKDHGWLDYDDCDTAALEPFLGLSREDARTAIVKWFKQHDLMAEVRPYRHAVGHSYRSHVPVEPYLSDQWYVKVTDDRLAGAALRAMAQRTDSPSTPVTSRDREGAGPDTLHYLITFTTHGTWLHGNAQGSADRDHNQPGTPYLPQNESLARHEAESMQGDAKTLDAHQRPIVRDTLQEVCENRGWSLHAANVRSNHVHIVIAAADTPEKVMNDLKAFATRRLTEAGLHTQGDALWTRHGSTRYLNDERSVAAAVRYVLEEQGADLGGVAHGEDPRTSGPLPDGRGSYAEHTGDLRFTPDRYAKTFQTWHENIRDWCISRQLWWGHRIPVWSNPIISRSTGDDVLKQTSEWAKQGRIAFQSHDLAMDDPEKRGEFICVLKDDDREVIAYLERNGYEQDPDVLDTWFSSALWPLSTMGWPDGLPDEGLALLNTFNPTSVLCTAREIITLWVSRMVMFNTYFNQGKLPFKNVYIHAMIQDGHGQKMSKSLGNGVDPLDIIHSHGSDAMRYTLCHMTTQTQDVRMPVDMVDPHTGETFEPRYITAKNGYKVAAPIQERNGKKFASSYGVASGEAKPTDDLPAARNTSSKFDLGRNFTTKLWNATRFVLDAMSEAEPHDGRSDLSIPDRWMLSRTARAVQDVDKLLAAYDFHGYAMRLYRFVWDDLCDWYIESVKHVIRTPTAEGEASRRVLAAVLDTALRLLHPVMPFVTEKLFEALNEAVPRRGVRGLDPVEADLLATAPWPTADAALEDHDAETRFERLQQLVGMVRETRAAAGVKPREALDVSVRIDDDHAASLKPMQHLFESLTSTTVVAMGSEVEKPENAAIVTRPGADVYLHVQIDAAEEADRLDKRAAELTKQLANLDGRLSNEKYISKAPSHLVQETRDQRAAAAAELERVQAQRAAL